MGGVLNERVASRLSIQPPSAYLVQTYLEKIADEHEVEWKPKVPLRAADIAQPMPAPGGYSVPVGGGSGLNPSTFDEGGASGDRNDGGGASAPPASPSFGGLPHAPAPHGAASAAASPQPRSPYVPVLPTPDAQYGPPSTMDDVEEVDIHVPGAPKAPPGGGSGHDRTNNGGGGGDDSDDGGDGGEGVGAPRGRTQSAGEGSGGAAPPPPADGGQIGRAHV